MSWKTWRINRREKKAGHGEVPYDLIILHEVLEWERALRETEE